MAIGDQQDCVFRIKANLPQHWFNDSTPILDAIINGLASTLAFIYSLIQYAQNQTRIATAMELLSPRERVVFEMKHYQGLKLRAIGDALGTTEETVKNSLFRATRKLRHQLGELR